MAESTNSGKTCTFKLRSGVKFHNGATFTSADVVWSWKRYLDPNPQWLCLAEFDGSQGLRIERIQATDPMTVAFKLNQARPLFLTQIASFQCVSGGILHKDSVNVDGTCKVPIGTGPIAAMAARPELMQKFSRDLAFGGKSVSCATATAMAVLDLDRGAVRNGQRFSTLLDRQLKEVRHSLRVR